MSSRYEEKQRRKGEREARERQIAAAGQRSRRMRLSAAAAVAVLAVGGGAAAVVGASGGADEVPDAMAGVDRGEPFGPHYEGLEERREAAKVTTMMDTMNDPRHVHPKLTVYVDGEPVGVPGNIGIEPGKPGMDMASLHTHAPDGTVHVEGQPNATLGQFMQVWGVPLAANRLGPYWASGDKTVRMWVDGKRSDAFGALKLKEGQEIVLSYGRKDAPAPKA
jgi:hypothetical protein